MRLVLVMALVAGCGVTEAGDYTRTVDGVEIVEVEAPAQAAPATQAIVAAYDRILGVDMSAITVRVRWAESLPDDLLGATNHGSFGCSTWIVSGAMFSYPKVLPHELGHCARWLLTGDGDHEHTDDSWWGRGGYVEQAHAAEAAAGY